MKRITCVIAAGLAMMSVVSQNLPYITKVYDFLPAPGQFVNISPQCAPGEPRDSVIARVENAICGSTKIKTIEKLDGTIITDTVVDVKPGLISLGSYGGYVVFGFDHPVVNVAGELDFQVFGNAMQSDQSTLKGGSCEPGIVMVSRDVNGNGLPDDPWYELAGCEYNNPRTQKDFTITYYKPNENKTPVPGSSTFITDKEYVYWTCNSVDSLQAGYVEKNSFHNQSYWPHWIDAEALTFTGTKLRCNSINESTVGESWVQCFFDWGYVDNRPDYAYGYIEGEPKDNQNMGFNIDWAVDDDGNKVTLTSIDFIKVYAAELQQCGWLGETSTEVCGGIDLHPDAVLATLVGDVDGSGIVDVDDVNCVINVILGKTSTYSTADADVNASGIVDVDDVNAIINIILTN